MNNLDIYCVTHVPLPSIERLGYIMAGAGDITFPKEYLTCNHGKNIIEKEKNYSEYVFHYWFWKNKLKSYDDNTWIGFCQKRRFWLQKKIDFKPKNFDELNKAVLRETPEEWKNYDSIIQPPLNLKEKKMVMLTFKDSQPGSPLLLHDEPIYYNSKIVGRTTSGNYSFNYKKNMSFGYIKSEYSSEEKNIEIEVEIKRYKAIIETKPLHDPRNINIKL